MSDRVPVDAGEVAAVTADLPLSPGVVSESGRFDGLGLGDPSRRYRLGIMGGTFDPIHLGHLVCAEQARDQFDLDAVVFVPTGRPAWKQDRYVSDVTDRLAMLRIAIAGNDAFDVSRIEADRPGVTYTVDTLQELHDHYPGNVDLFFITGTDAIGQIAAWRDHERIARLASFIAASRPGYDVDEAKRANEASGFDINYFEVPALAISSTDLRERVRAGRSVRYLVPKGVEDYIAGHGLYTGDV